jgi:hypothetical protein
MPTRTTDAPSTDPAAPGEHLAGAGAPTAPGIPSFASLRDARRRSPVDALFAAGPPATPPDSPRAAAGPATDGPAAAPPRAASPAPARTAAAVRPPEWADLWHLGVHVTAALAGVPARVVRSQVGCLRSLLLGR